MAEPERPNQRRARRPGLGLLALSALLAVGCAGAPSHSLVPVLAPAGAEGHGVTATFKLDTSQSSLYRRGVLYLEPSSQVRVTVEGPDLDKPFTSDQTLSTLAGGVSLTVKDIPPGTMRVVTLQWVDPSGQPIEGLYYRAQGPLDVLHRQLIFNNVSTAEGEVMLSLIKRHPDSAALMKSEDVTAWMGSAIATAHAPNPRFLDFDAVADGMVGLNAKHIPVPKPEWRVEPGYVSVSFKDVQKGLKLRVSINDATSGAVITDSGDTVLLGPVLARSTPYRVGVRVLPTGDESIGSDLSFIPVEATVNAGATTIQPPISLAQSAPGAPMPDRVGRGGTATLDGTDAQLWILNGLKYPDGDPTSIGLIDSNPVTASGKAYRYRRSDGWSTPLTLPANFPLYGTATAVSGSKIYCFGGFVNQEASNNCFVLETSGTPTVTAGPFSLPAADGESPLTLAGSVAATIGNFIYVAGGLAHAPAALNPDGSLSQGATDTGLGVTLAFKPSTGTWDSVSLPGPPGPYKSMAGAVVGQKWYCFGGFREDREPLGDVQIFDSNSRTWTSGAHPMPTPRYGAATAVVNGQIWVIGGETVRGEPTRVVEVYDPVNDAWTRRAPLHTPSSYAGAAPFKNASGTKIVVGAGVAGVSPIGFPLPIGKSQVEELSP